MSMKGCALFLSLLMLLVHLAGCSGSEDGEASAHNFSELDSFALIHIPEKFDNTEMTGKSAVPRTYRDVSIDALDYWGMPHQMTNDVFTNFKSNSFNFSTLILIEPNLSALQNAQGWSDERNSPVLIIETTNIGSEVSDYFGINDHGTVQNFTSWDYSNYEEEFRDSISISDANPSNISFEESSWTTTPLIQDVNANSFAFIKFENNGTIFYMYVAESYYPGVGVNNHHMMILNYLQESDVNHQRTPNIAETITPIVLRLDDLRYTAQIDEWNEYYDACNKISIGYIPENSNLSSDDLKDNFPQADIIPHGYSHEDWHELNSSQAKITATKSSDVMFNITGIYPNGMIMPYNHLGFQAAQGLQEAGFLWATSSISQSKYPSNIWFDDGERFIQFSNYFSPSSWSTSEGTIHEFINESESNFRGGMVIFHPNRAFQEGEIEHDISIIDQLLGLEESDKIVIMTLSEFMEYHFNRISPIVYYEDYNSGG